MTIAPQKLQIGTSGSNTIPMNISYDQHQQQQQQYAALQQTLHLNNQSHSYATSSNYNFQSQLKPEQTISPAVLTQTTGTMGPTTGINPAALTLQKTDNLQNNSSVSANGGNNVNGANNNELKRSYSSMGDDLELENIIDDVEFEPKLKIQRTS